MSYTVNESQVIDAWAGYLDIDWSVFATFTTLYRTTRNSARNKMNHLFEILSLKYGSATSMFWVAEPFKDRHRFHMHALIKIKEQEDLITSSILKAWHQVSRPSGRSTGKLAYIEKYDKTKGGRFYIAKHLNKANVDFDLF
jgi:hypothetical protein